MENVKKSKQSAIFQTLFQITLELNFQLKNSFFQIN